MGEKSIDIRYPEHKGKEFNNNEAAADSNGSEEFGKKLSLLPGEIKDLFLTLPAETRIKIIKSYSDQERSDYSEPNSLWIEIEKDMAAERHRRNEWTEEEIKEMSSEQREIIFFNALYDFLRSVGFEEMVRDNPGSVGDILDLLWSNRGKRESEVKLFRGSYFADIENQLNSFKQNIKSLVDRLNKLSGKKKHLNRPNQQEINRLRNQLAKDYGLIWRRGQDHLDPSPFTGENQEKIQRLEEELSKKELESAWQSTLNYILEYMDAVDFGVLFSEVAEFILKPDRMGANKEIAQKVAAAVDKWSSGRQGEKPFKQGRDEPKNEREKKLITHFNRLFRSYLSLKNNKDTTSDQLTNTERELAVAVHLLKRLP